MPDDVVLAGQRTAVAAAVVHSMAVALAADSSAAVAQVDCSIVVGDCNRAELELELAHIVAAAAAAADIAAAGHARNRPG